MPWKRKPAPPTTLYKRLHVQNGQQTSALCCLSSKYVDRMIATFGIKNIHEGSALNLRSPCKLETLRDIKSPLSKSSAGLLNCQLARVNWQFKIAQTSRRGANRQHFFVDCTKHCCGTWLCCGMRNENGSNVIWPHSGKLGNMQSTSSTGRLPRCAA